MMKLRRVAAALSIVAVAITTASCTRHNQNTTATTTSASTAAGASSTLPRVAPVSGPHLPPFVPSPGVGANCQYPRANEPISKQAGPPPAGKTSTEPAQIGLTIVTDRGPMGLQLANHESPCT